MNENAMNNRLRFPSGFGSSVFPPSQVAGAGYQIFVRCVMDTTDPMIRFNRSGVCNHCVDFIQRRLTQAQSDQPSADHVLDRLASLRATSPRKADFDCIVGVSGGVDSTYTALLAAKAGLRVLAVHMDNGWDTAASTHNIRQLCQQPGINYRSAVLNWPAFREVQRAFLLAGVVEAEAPTDVAIQRVMHDVAVSLGVPIILSGGNIATEGILPKAWLYNGRDMHYNRSVCRAVGVGLDGLAHIGFGLRRELSARLIHRIRTLYPLNCSPTIRRSLNHFS